MNKEQHWSRFLTFYHQNDHVLRECAQHDSFHQFWEKSKRGDIMLCIAGIWSKREPLVLAACACARLALPYVKSGEDRPRIAIETAEAWARGEVDIEQVKAATYAVVRAPQVTAVDTCICNAAYCAGYCAYTANVADYSDSAAYYAARTADAFYDPNPGNVFDVAYYQTLEKCADIVRQMLPKPPFQRYYDLRAFL